jgi:hypothetical protein
LDSCTLQNLEIVNEKVKDDFDAVILIVGPERMGKSTLGNNVACVLDPRMTTGRMVWSTAHLRWAIAHAKPYSCILQHEGANTWLSMDANKAENRKMVRCFMQIGEKNLKIIILVPDVAMIQRYLKQFRALAMLRVTTRGHFKFYSRKRIKLIHVQANTKKMIWPKENFRGWYRRPLPETPFWEEYHRLDHEFKSSQNAENPKVVEAELRMDKFKRDTVTMGEAAKMLGLKRGTFEAWAWSGRLKKKYGIKPFETMAGKRFYVKDITALQRKGYGNHFDKGISKEML